mmetsp:Transcript_128061/g.221268  ORF Transcript_128061/g.221268 Transcript_128061/m.221268 type:complete len:228 (+) Transcript_128061:922-1605(+)
MELVACIIDVGSLGDVVDLGGDNDALVGALEGAGPVEKCGLVSGDPAHEGIEGRSEAVHEPLVGRDVHRQVFAVDDQAADLLQLGDHAVPVSFHLHEQVLEEGQVRQTAHLLPDESGGVVHGGQAAHAHAVAGTQQAPLHSCLALHDHLLELCLIVEFRLQQHVTDNVHEVLQLVGRPLAADHQLGAGLTPRVQHGGRHDGLGDAADLALDALGQGHKILLLGAELR